MWFCHACYNLVLQNISISVSNQVMWYCDGISDFTYFLKNILVEKLLFLWNRHFLIYVLYIFVAVLYMNHFKKRVKLNYITCDPSAKVQIRFSLNIAFMIMFMIIQSFNKMKWQRYDIFEAGVRQLIHTSDCFLLQLSKILQSLVCLSNSV